MFIRWIYLAAALVFALPARASNPLVIKTDQGKVQGKMSADGQVRDFLGIPFAAPPVGPLRWKPPQPAAKWHGVRQATSFGSRCVQQEHYSDMVFRDPGESEDCLTLNVWTPAAKAEPGWRTPHPQRCAGGLHELPAGYLRFLCYPGTCC
jgi:para-nitrobenzyl esterase